jgi:hypothetical protein
MRTITLTPTDKFRSRQDRFALDLDLGVGIDQRRHLDQGHRRKMPAKCDAPRRAIAAPEALNSAMSVT